MKFTTRCFYLYTALAVTAGCIVGISIGWSMQTAQAVGPVPTPRFEQEGYLADVPSNAIEIASGTPVLIASRRLYRPWGTEPWTWGYECQRPDGTDVSLDDNELLSSATAEDEYDRARDKRRDAEYEQQIAKNPYGEILEEGGSLIVRNMAIPRRITGLNLVEHRKELPSVRILGTTVHERYLRYWTDYGTTMVIPFPQAGDNIVWRVEEPHGYRESNAMVSAEGGAPGMTFSNISATWEEGMPDTFFRQESSTKETP